MTSDAVKAAERQDRITRAFEKEQRTRLADPERAGCTMVQLSAGKPPENSVLDDRDYDQLLKRYNKVFDKLCELERVISRY